MNREDCVTRLWRTVLVGFVSFAVTELCGLGWYKVLVGTDAGVSTYFLAPLLEI